MAYYQKISEVKHNLPGAIHQIPVEKILPNPNQPRKHFSQDSIIRLANSISQYGIIQPLTVRKSGEFYEIVAGERRLRAANELGMATVPCIISDINESKSAEIAIIENIIREDLNIFEQAEAIKALIDTYELTQEQIATRLSNSQSFVANKLRLLRFTAEEKEQIIKNNLTERHARALLRVSDPSLREKLLSQVVLEGLNVSATEALIDLHISDKNIPIASTEAKVSPISPQFKSISAFYGTVNRAVEAIKRSGIAIKSRKIENDSFTELTILISKEPQANNASCASRQTTSCSSCTKAVEEANDTELLFEL